MDTDITDSAPTGFSPERFGKRTHIALHILAFSLFFLILFMIRGSNEKLYHILAELISIVIAFGIFMLVWPARRLLSNDFLLFLGFAYLVVGSIDLMHTVSYKGMGIILPDSADPPTQLWIIARYLESAALLGAPVFLKKKLPEIPALLASVGLVVLALYSVFRGDFFPVCYVEGVGLTRFKIFSEYLISLMVLLAIVRLYRTRGMMNRQMYGYMLASMVFTIMAELSFTLYTDVYGFFNVLGHGFKIVSFYYIYRSLIETGLKNPLDVLFANLQNQEAELRQQNENLQEEITNRIETERNLQQITGDLKTANQRVQARLEELMKDKQRLVAEISATALQKSDILQNNARVLKELHNCNYEKEILYEQLNYYVRIVEQSQSDIGKILE